MKILVLSSLYPNDVQRRHGIFIEHRVAHLVRPGDAVRVVSPVPWFPFGSRHFGRYGDLARVPAAARRRGVPIEHPRHLVIPKVGMTVAPWLMAAALIDPIARVRREFDFDVIDSYYLYPDGIAAGLLARIFDRPFMATALGSDVSLIPRARAARAMILGMIRRAGMVTCVAAALRDELLAMGAAADKVVVVEQGVDLDLFRPPIDRQSLRASLAVVGPTLLSVGHLIERKGHHLAIEAIATLPGVTLMIAGDGPCEGALRAQAAQLGVGERVRFLGHVDQAALPALYGAADATVNCSDREGIANVLLESLACGTPLVATPVWGSPEVVRVPAAGVLTADRSAVAIAAGIAQLLGDPPARSAAWAYGRRYDCRATGRLHRALLDDVVAGFDYRQQPAYLFP